MSIDRDTFESASEEELADLSATDQVLGFLGTNSERAFKAAEVARQTDLDSGTVSTALSRLKDRELVEHKAAYWAITEDEKRLQSYDGYSRATALFNEQLGAEDGDEWAKHAPEDLHPNQQEDEQ